MVKNKKNSWIWWLVLAAIIIALIIIAVILNSKTTGNAIFNFGKNHSKDVSYMGILGNSFIKYRGSLSSLKGYEVKYDSDGNLIYEIINQRTEIKVGLNYSINQTSNTTFEIYSLTTGQEVGGGSCGCSNDGGPGKCTNGCVYNNGKCHGSCSGSACTSKTCSLTKIMD